MRRAARIAVFTLLLALLVPPAFANGLPDAEPTDAPTSPSAEPTPEPTVTPGDDSESGSGAEAEATPESTPESTESTGADTARPSTQLTTQLTTQRTEKRGRWAPPDGAIFSNPTTRNGRIILHRILRAVRETNRKQFVRIATWNFADRRATDTLIKAKKRGVRVQVITAGSTDSRPWKRLQRFLNRNRSDKNWAKKCRGACRSKGYAMHMKFALFSKVNWKKHVSMVGSWNLTKAAGNRQWNDNVTQSHYGLYRKLRRTFAQMKRDRNFPPHPTNYTPGRYHLQLWPTYNKNPIAKHLRKVRCWHDGRRTRIRIAIASWWDSFGQTVANVVRRKWNRGCNIRILITDAGGGIMRTLRAKGGRGPIPVKRLTVCCSSEGVPSKYLHMKAIAIAGKYGSRNRTKVLLTGSPNWSTAARKTDELVLRIHRSGGMVKRYMRHINRWYRGPVAHRSASTRSGDGTVLPRLSRRTDLPDWFELE